MVRRNDVPFQFVELVRHHTKLDIQDYPEQSVASHRETEKFIVLIAATPNDRTIGFHESERFDR